MKPQTREEEVLASLRESAELFAGGDGQPSAKRRAIVISAIRLWDMWPNIRGEFSLHDGVLKNLRLAIAAAADLLSRESERVGIDSTVLFRAARVVKVMITNPLGDRQTLSSADAAAWYEGDAAVSRLETILQVREDEGVGTPLPQEQLEEDAAWPKQADVARQLGKERYEVQRLIVAGELRTNNKRRHKCRVDPASVLEYCDRNGVQYGGE
ncbi:MAG: hypothetical protein ACYC4U_20900 [Pirellulaceae bacterium]